MEEWPCACGCGTMLSEKISYRKNGRIASRKRSTYVVNHHPHGQPPDSFFVSTAAIATVIRKHLERTGMSYRELNGVLGYSTSIGGGVVSKILNNQYPKMRKSVAERILRRLAGLPTLPTAHERAQSDRPDPRPEQVKWNARKSAELEEAS